MSDAQHTQEKEALEDASNRLLVLDGQPVGTLAYTMVGTWTTKDGGVVTGPGYTVRFAPSAQLKAWKAAYDAAQAAPPTTPPVDPPKDPPPPVEPPSEPPPVDPPADPQLPSDGSAPNIGAIQPGDTFVPPDAP